MSIMRFSRFQFEKFVGLSLEKLLSKNVLNWAGPSRYYVSSRNGWVRKCPKLWWRNIWMVPYLSLHDISHSFTALFELHIQSKQAQKGKNGCKLTSTPGRGCRAPWSAHRPTWWGSVRSWWSRSRSVSASRTWRSWIPTTAVRWWTSSVRRISPAPWRCPPKNKIELLIGRTI